jgi:hypothetical protein
MRGRALALATGSILMLVAAGCSELEVVTAAYATKTEAQQAGAFDRGSMPSFVPQGAHDIRAAHDPDRKRQWGLFNFLPADAETLRTALEPDEAPLAGTRCDIPERIEWWPVLLRGSLNPASIADAGLKAYRARTADLLVAVNWRQGRAYYFPK